ncbi:epithelial membrane protein 1 [Homo sapiens]|uniref:Isoform 2 of Epithelial membrane protein 1 n=1 Tax=Homo sapiens TaxID=9606 RepID=P54849-2|nr:epithelial membrane protein 1 [Homo sapiens]KAI4064803.1 epithelial membrane protein 1 [Homo sapiens]BAG61373.1 unnamed protein product [Homo sapiens]
MLVLLAGIFVVHIATVIMLFVSTIANVWLVSNTVDASVGLWKNCTNISCSDSLSYASEDALKTVQAFMILSIIFCVIALLVFVFQLFTMEKGNRFFLSGATTLVCFIMRIVMERSITTAIPTSWAGSASASASSSAFSIWS